MPMAFIAPNAAAIHFRTRADPHGFIDFLQLLVSRAPGHLNILRACNKTSSGTRRVRAFGPITKHCATTQDLRLLVEAVEMWLCRTGARALVARR